MTAAQAVNLLESLECHLGKSRLYNLSISRLYTEITYCLDEAARAANWFPPISQAWRRDAEKLSRFIVWKLEKERGQLVA